MNYIKRKDNGAYISSDVISSGSIKNKVFFCNTEEDAEKKAEQFTDAYVSVVRGTYKVSKLCC